MIARIRRAIHELDHEFVVPAMGMCIGYICHDALQERMFRFDGFVFGWFMTLAEVTIMILCGLLQRWNQRRNDSSNVPSLVKKGTVLPAGSTATITTMTAIMGLCITISHGCGNTALRYTTYPLKVAFKSCKLIPTMWLGLLILRKKFNRNQYGSATIMCVGLVVLTLADTWGVPSKEEQEKKGGLHHLMIGPILLAVSTSLDSVVPNLQERLFTTTSITTNEVMLLSNLWMFLLSLAYNLMTGELVLALAYCLREKQTLAVLFLQACCAYVGLRCYLTVIQHHGGVAAVILANGRKSVTISLSFLLWSKPFSWNHGVGLGLIFLGVYLGVVAKQRKSKAAAGKKNHNGDDANNIESLSVV